LRIIATLLLFRCRFIVQNMSK